MLSHVFICLTKKRYKGQMYKGLKEHAYADAMLACQISLNADTASQGSEVPKGSIALMSCCHAQKLPAGIVSTKCNVSAR